MNKLKELEGICVRGSKEHGARIIQAFTDAGAVNNLAFTGKDDTNKYFVKGGVVYGWREKTNHLTEITIDQLEEIVYKVDWENPPKYVKSKRTSLIVKFENEATETAFQGICVVGDNCYNKGHVGFHFAREYFRLLTSSELADLEKELETPKKIAGVDFKSSLESLEAITVKIDGNSLDEGWGNSTHESRMKGMETIAEHIKENAPELFEQPVKFTVYQRLRVLGFKKLKLNDKIFRDIHGHNPYQMRKQLDSKTFFTWDYSTPEKEDVQLVQEGVIVGRSTVEEVERILEKLK